MALPVFDASSSGTAGSVSSLTIPHTCTGTNRYLVGNLEIADTGNTVTCTGATYNGVAMTNALTWTEGTAARFYIFTLANPSTGTNNIVYTYSGAPSAVSRAGNVSYTGAQQTSVPNVAAQTVQPSATSITTSVTTTLANCILVGNGCAHTNVLTAGANTVKRLDAGGPDTPAVFESTGTQSPAGSYSLTYTSASAALSLGVIGIAPFTAAASNAGFLAFM